VGVHCNNVGVLIQVISMSHSDQTWLFSFSGFVFLACGMRNHVIMRFELIDIRAWLLLLDNILLLVESHYFQSSSIPFELWQLLHLQKKKMLFCFVSVSIYISNIKTKKKESRLNKYIIDIVVEIKTKWNWIKPHWNYLKIYILVI
jgi:hypothetical protein